MCDGGSRGHPASDPMIGGRRSRPLSPAAVAHPAPGVSSCPGPRRRLPRAHSARNRWPLRPTASARVVPHGRLLSSQTPASRRNSRSSSLLASRSDSRFNSRRTPGEPAGGRGELVPGLVEPLHESRGLVLDQAEPENPLSFVPQDMWDRRVRNRIGYHFEPGSQQRSEHLATPLLTPQPFAPCPVRLDRAAPSLWPRSPGQVLGGWVAGWPARPRMSDVGHRSARLPLSACLMECRFSRSWCSAEGRGRSTSSPIPH